MHEPLDDGTADATTACDALLPLRKPPSASSEIANSITRRGAAMIQQQTTKQGYKRLPFSQESSHMRGFMELVY